MIIQTIFIVIIVIFSVVVVVRLQLKSLIESNIVCIVYLTYVYIDFFLSVCHDNKHTYIYFYLFFLQFIYIYTSLYPELRTIFTSLLAA